MPRKAPSLPKQPTVVCGRCRRELPDDLCRLCIGIITHLPPTELMTPVARSREVLSYQNPIVGLPEDIICERVYRLCNRRYQGDSWAVDPLTVDIFRQPHDRVLMHKLLESMGVEEERVKSFITHVRRQPLGS